MKDKIKTTLILKLAADLNNDRLADEEETTRVSIGEANV